MDDRNWQGRKLHLIGIGGAGMSGLAWVAAGHGAEVTGSDRSESSYLARLREAGIEPAIGHDATNLPAGAEVVVSSAIADDNPELVLARERGQRVMHRSELLAELCRERRTVAVAGTHGKSTTTGMLVHALRQLGHDPSWLIGAQLAGPEPGDPAVNADWGAGEWLVAEADESDGSFLRLEPETVVITNVEMDHPERWSNLGELRTAFRDFASSASRVILPAGDADLAEPTDRLAVSQFGPDFPGPAELGLATPGAHNRLNARAALAALTAIGIDPEEAVAALATFGGVRRRLEYRGTVDGTRIYDDYAHHPTEVRAALAALLELEPRRLVAVFQPHLYSRTRTFAREFGAALAVADEVIGLDIYAARELPVGRLAGVSGLDVLRATADRNGGRPVWWAPDLDTAERVARSRFGPDTILVTLGAGDVTEIAGRLADG